MLIEDLLCLKTRPPRDLGYANEAMHSKCKLPLEEARLVSIGLLGKNFEVLLKIIIRANVNNVRVNKA